ncbi:MAG: GrpB family protein [Spirochaetales bacterium]|nr:GrpB family protein [Spirochaetales bacterium]
MDDILPKKALSLYVLGLDWDKLSIIRYNPLWPVLYKAESNRILNKLSPWLEKLEHIGSTAVINMSAKPIIDIIGMISSTESIDSQLLNFYELGYHYLGECGRPGRYFLTFNRGAATFFHLHLVDKDSLYWFDLVSFRDKLRSNKELASNYSRHKLYLLKNYDNRKKYREGKEEWFNRIKP